LLPETGGYEAEKLIKRIKELCEKESIEGMKVSVSFGYGTIFNEEEKKEIVLAKADNMMYNNKRHNKK